MVEGAGEGVERESHIMYIRRARGWVLCLSIHERVWNSAALHGQRVSGGGRGGCVFGRGQLQERTHRPSHQGEPSLLQDVEGQAQLGLWNPDPATRLQKVLHVPPTLGHRRGFFWGGHMDAGTDRAACLFNYWRVI